MLFSIITGGILFVLGILIEATIGVNWNMPGVGYFISILLLGVTILWSVRNKK